MIATEHDGRARFRVDMQVDHGQRREGAFLGGPQNPHEVLRMTALVGNRPQGGAPQTGQKAVAPLRARSRMLFNFSVDQGQ